MHRRLTALAFALAVGAPALARADHVRGAERTDIGAYTLKANEMSVGIQRFEMGLFKPVTLGTYTLPWFLFPILSVPVPSAWLKIRDWFYGPVAVAVRGGFIYLDARALASKAAEGSARASVWVLPITASVSARLHERITESVELSYLGTALSADIEAPTTIGGASVTSIFSMAALTEVRLSRKFALDMLHRLSLYRSPVSVTGAVETDGIEVQPTMTATSTSGPLYSFTTSLHMSFGPVNLRLGVGYGAFWIPMAEVPVQLKFPMPDFDFYVRF
jgi:hypothetical protein